MTRCALCGRTTLQPAVLIGAEAIGPKCAKRAGLIDIKPRPGSRLFVPTRRPARAVQAGETPDLFAEVAA